MANREKRIPNELALRGFTFEVQDRTELLAMIKAELNTLRLALLSFDENSNPADIEPMCWNVLHVQNMVGKLEEWIEEVVA